MQASPVPVPNNLHIAIEALVQKIEASPLLISELEDCDEYLDVLIAIRPEKED